jgi:hypothetical protein
MEGIPIPKKLSTFVRRAAPWFLLFAGATGCRRAAPSAAARPVPRSPNPTAASNPPVTLLPAAPAKDPGYGLTLAESAAVRRYLGARPEMRLATDEDSRPTDESNDMAKLYGVYHPYFVRGDVDDDGLLDFVAGFVDRSRPSSSAWFSVVVFRGDGRGGFQPPVELERQVSLENGDLAIDRDSVLVTPDLSQETGRRYRWNPRHGGFDFVSDADASDSDRQPSNRI